MKKGLLFSLSFLIGAMAFAQTFVSTTRSTKNVLIEEFTGINCGYCPDGHRIVGEVMAAHPNNVFAINIIYHLIHIVTNVKRIYAINVK